MVILSSNVIKYDMNVSFTKTQDKARQRDKFYFEMTTTRTMTTSYYIQNRIDCYVFELK